ncbi:MAG: hypothetical protein ABIC40_01585, partial [bacterium]
MFNSSKILFLPPIRKEINLSSPVKPWQRWGSGGGLVFNRKTLESRDHLVLADNLDLLGYLPDSCVDLVYIDPPFATGTRRESPKGGDGPSGFDDNWESVGEFVTWLMPRIIGLWRILSPDGNLVIHLDPRA